MQTIKNLFLQIGGEGDKNNLRPGYWYNYALAIDMPKAMPEDNVAFTIDVSTAFPDNTGNTIITRTNHP